MRMKMRARINIPGINLCITKDKSYDVSISSDEFRFKDDKDKLHIVGAWLLDDMFTPNHKWEFNEDDITS